MAQVILVIGLFGLGLPWGISGVAMAVNVMAIVGMVILLAQAKKYIQFSIVRLFLVPSIALIISMVLARLAIGIPGIVGSDWRTGFVKVIVFVPLYVGILVVLERKWLLDFAIGLKQLLAKKP